ncbi:nucleotidyltransferase family protein [Planctomycetota bacterium]
MSVHIDISNDKIVEFCQRNHICSFAFFGSVLRDEFSPDSDIDVLVEFEEVYNPSLMELASIENELSEVFGRKADMVERRSVEQSKNYIRRRHVLESLEAVYVA